VSRPLQSGGIRKAGSKSFLSRQRVGEASKPGPAQPTKEGWAIAAINPTGLAGKAKQFSDLPAGIYAISETHLSERGQVRFREELFHAKNMLKLYPGYRAPLKKDSIQAVGGKHTGVAFLTHFPTRPIVSGWNEELYQTSRIHAAVFLVHNTWVAGGVCYGYAKDSDSPAVQDNTNRLLQEVARQVMQGFKGPAFIAGDFNQVPGVLHETVKWEQQGWRDVQTWAAEKYGINPGVTCQFTTRKILCTFPQNCKSCCQVVQTHLTDGQATRLSWVSLASQATRNPCHDGSSQPQLTTASWTVK